MKRSFPSFARHSREAALQTDILRANQILRGTHSGSYNQFIKNCYTQCPRQALHALTLGFKHPRTEEEMDFSAELPEDMAGLIERWRNYVKGAANL